MKLFWLLILIWFQDCFNIKLTDSWMPHRFSYWKFEPPYWGRRIFAILRCECGEKIIQANEGGKSRLLYLLSNTQIGGCRSKYAFKFNTLWVSKVPHSGPFTQRILFFPFAVDPLRQFRLHFSSSILLFPSYGTWAKGKLFVHKDIHIWFLHVNTVHILQ